MQFGAMIVGYFSWHYSVRAFRDIFVVWSNLTWFITHLFSIPLLLRTLFAPWKRVQEAYRRTGFEDLMETLVLNIVSRIFGALVRTFIIGTGLLALLASAAMLFVTYAFWLAAPVLIPFLFLYGLTFLL